MAATRPGSTTEPTRALIPARTRWDAVSLLTVLVVLLLGLPSDLRLPALGGAGVPAFIWAAGMGLWWCWTQVYRRAPLPQVGAHPVRRSAFVFLGCVLAGYIAAMERPLPAVEASQADIGMLRILIYLSVLLVAHDSISSFERLRTLLQRMVWAGTVVGSLGLLQFLTHQSLTGWISIPGFIRSQGFDAVGSRNGFIRAAGTAMNPLEYGVVLSVVFPLALTFALQWRRPDTDPAARWRTRPWGRWLPVGILGAALLVSGSRSSLLGLAVGFVVLFVFWDRRTRLWMSLAGLAALVVVAVAVPGLIGTMRYLFTNTSQDSSVQSRSGSYDIAGQFIANAPLFGRGFGTYLPEYRIFDNAYLSMAVELGLVGLGTFLVMIVAAIACALLGRRTITSTGPEQDRALGVALAAAVAAGAVLTAFFDALSFPMSAGLLFLALGLCGSYRRLLRIRCSSEAPGPGSVPVATSVPGSEPASLAS